MLKRSVVRRKALRKSMRLVNGVAAADPGGCGMTCAERDLLLGLAVAVMVLARDSSKSPFLPDERDIIGRVPGAPDCDYFVPRRLFPLLKKVLEEG